MGGRRQNRTIHGRITRETMEEGRDLLSSHSMLNVANFADAQGRKLQCKTPLRCLYWLHCPHFLCLAQGFCPLILWHDFDIPQLSPSQNHQFPWSELSVDLVSLDNVRHLGGATSSCSCQTRLTTPTTDALGLEGSATSDQQPTMTNEVRSTYSTR